jgi:hypothetical protein
VASVARPLERLANVFVGGVKASDVINSTGIRKDCKVWSMVLVDLALLGVGWLLWDSYLVDPASSHMLVSKIKPCMSKYKQICTVKLRMAH